MDALKKPTPAHDTAEPVAQVLINTKASFPPLVIVTMVADDVRAVSFADSA